MKRFCENFNRLPDSVKTRLTVENDDKASMYSVVDLYEGVYKVIGIPIVFDYHHHIRLQMFFSIPHAFQKVLSHEM